MPFAINEGDVVLTIKHVVFDIGGVLIHWDPEIPFKILIPDAEERKQFLAEICSPTWNAEQDRGRSWEDAEAELIALHPTKIDLIRAFRGNWHSMVPYAYEDSVALFRDLIAKGVDVTMLTNWAADTFDEAQPMFPFLKESRGVTVSGRVKLIKPDQAIFDHHAKTFGLDPASTVFIDDSFRNIEGARAAGWQALHFQDAETLARDLRDLGVPAALPNKNL